MDTNFTNSKSVLAIGIIVISAIAGGVLLKDANTIKIHERELILPTSTIIKESFDSIEVTPDETIKGSSRNEKLAILEYHVNPETKKDVIYIVYLSSDSKNWNSEISPSELYLELDDFDNNDDLIRTIVSNTGVDFSSDVEQFLALTAPPIDSKNRRLRLIHAKTKEAGVSNKFYVQNKLQIE